MIAAIILAAGESRRMGQPKMLLPWGSSTVLQTVVGAYASAPVADILVVTGAGRNEVETLLGNSVRTIFNGKYAVGQMLGSLQVALAEQKPETQAVLIALGDQPQLDAGTVQKILGEYQHSPAALVVPSFQMHRGHPWLVGRDFWEEIRSMSSPETLRDFLSRHRTQIRYVEMDTPTVLQDLDTPDDYLQSGPSIARAA